MGNNKTQKTAQDPIDFLKSVVPERRGDEGIALLELFERVTGFTPHMWGDSIVGFGRYDYQYKSGRKGSFLATGFSPRKARLVVYIMPGYQPYPEIMARLGKHKLGKSCLYINKLADIDLEVLGELVAAGLDDLAKLREVHPN